DESPLPLVEVEVRRPLTVAGIVDPARPLDADAERLLVAVVLQGRPADAVADRLGHHSAGECLRATGEALATLVDRHGGPTAERERERYD
ncbi:tRNA(Met) cytidine acetyltransferase, partial [Halobacteriales archaeon SW_7_71_33]